MSFTSGLSAIGVSALASKAWGQPALRSAQREGGPPPPAPYAAAAADVFPQQDPSVVREAVIADGMTYPDAVRVGEYSSH